MTKIEYFLLWVGLPLSVVLNCIYTVAWVLLIWKDEVVNTEEPH